MIRPIHDMRAPRHARCTQAARPNPRTSRKRGFILPTVLILVALATAIGAALVSASWRTSQGARTAWAGEQALHAADLALAATSESWTPSNIAKLAVGQRQTIVTAPSARVSVTVTSIRTTTSTLLIDATAAITNGAITAARRHVSRVVELDASAMPIRGALMALGDIGINGASVIATGIPASPETSCGIDTDSSSTAALSKTTPMPPDTSTVIGAPRTRIIPVDSATIFRNNMWLRITQLATANEITADNTTIGPAATGTTCTGASGEPRRDAGSISACHNHWPVRLLSNTSGTVTLGTSRHQGTLIVDGNLTLAGTLTVRGLLVVRGIIDTRAAALDLTGTLVTLQQANGRSELNNATTIRFSRCALLRAVTPLATIGTPPVLAWVERH